jgi:hypothetical protein
MLNTDDRLLLSEALTPPPGYQPDLLVGTTYSLQLSALLSVPLAMTFADWEREDGAPSRDGIAALEAVRRHAEHITVFCQAGATAATDHPPLVASWLEDVVVPVKAPYGGVFHPKVWMARYRSVDGGAPAYRMLSASRNLTFDRSWDTVLVLDGAPTARGGRAHATDPLADFLAALPTLATGAVKPARAASILQLADELRRVRFDPPGGFYDLAFCPMGIARHRADPFITRRTRMLVMAPFVGTGRLNAFDTEAHDSVLISRADELDCVATGALTGYSTLYALDEPEPPLEQSAGDGRALTGLHAKLYIADAGWESHVWTGSANATTAAFRDNVEFLVRLDGKRNACGIEATLGKAEDPLSLRAMLIEVEPRDEPGVPDPRVELERHLDGITHDLAERQIVARIRPQPAEGLFRVELHAMPAPELPADVTTRCWPLSSTAERRGVPVAKERAELLAVFVDQTLADITAFFTFELTLTRDEHTVVKAMLVRAELEGEPEGRRRAILRELLSDPEQVLRLLRALLAFDENPGAGLGPGLIGDLQTPGNGRAASESPLLESLLRALDEAPEKLDAIASLIDDLRDVGDVLPPGFVELCAPILAVRREGPS